MPVNTLIQLRRGTASTWSSANSNLGPVLAVGEVGYETDTGRLKIGDGSTVWNNLPYSYLQYNDLVVGSGIELEDLTNGNGQVTGVKVNNSILAGDNITLTLDGNNNIVIAGASPVTISAGTGIFVSQNGDDFTVNVVEETIRDFIGSTVVGGTGIYVNYDDNGDGNLHVNATGLAYAIHTHQLTDVTDVTATATEVNYLSGTTLGTVTNSNVVAVDSNKDINGFRDVGIDRNLTVGGNLVVNGTTTTVNSTIVDIGDNIIQVNVSGSETLGGFQVLKHGANAGLNQFVWDSVDGRWEFIGSDPDVYTSGDVTGRTFTSTVANGTAPFSVTSSTVVTNLNADKLDGQDGSYYLNWTNTTNKPDPIITGVLTGDVTGSSSVTLTDLANGVLTINTTIASNSVALGSDTTGQYASTLTVTGTGLSATTPNGDDATAYTITSNATPANTTGTLVARDSTGSFYAGTIYATFNGNGSSITNLNASNISAGTIGVAYLPTIPVTKLNASGVTIGNTTVNLGQTKTAFGGLTGLSGVSAAAPVVINYAHIDGGTP